MSDTTIPPTYPEEMGLDESAPDMGLDESAPWDVPDYPDEEEEDWSIPSFNQSNRIVWEAKHNGTDAVVELVDAGKPYVTQFVKTNQDKTPKLDENGKTIPVVQSKWTWEIVDIDTDNPERFVGTKITNFYSYSNHVKSEMHKTCKALFGGEIDPDYEPKRSELLHRMMKATIEVGEPKGNDGIRYPKVTNPRPYRQAPAAPTSKVKAKKAAETSGAAVPF